MITHYSGNSSIFHSSQVGLQEKHLYYKGTILDIVKNKMQHKPHLLHNSK